MAHLNSNLSTEEVHDGDQLQSAAEAAVPAAEPVKPKRRKSTKASKASDGAPARDTSAAPAEPPKASPRASDTKHSKSDLVLKKLRSAKGVTIEMLMEATGWQAHSVRGFLSAVVRKKLGLNLVSDVGKDGVRRYRIDDSAKDA
ncbi:DUF3489 domain-containing protein [Mesorhizobium sp.]|uniref:DUF3489 domain-containing protein n=1 Tax=Mesorhizobium sp. TaxID=1871066 RepID=UPI000FEA7D01|nr:DUF3489 domain-containing protein [Mesorhizobium sp.]RWI92118.1 MAG: DUF3489 domain-containing protein [Mesorhizobium sp.]